MALTLKTIVTQILPFGCIVPFRLNNSFTIIIEERFETVIEGTCERFADIRIWGHISTTEL